MNQGWDPVAYLRYADERARPFFELLARVNASDPAYVVDLGCGPGNLTAELSRRWPDAVVRGIDSSADMIAAAAPLARSGRLMFEEADLRCWQPERPVDVLVCNATLQWVPGHLDLLQRLVQWLPAGGWLAVQVPGNFDQPSHVLLRRLAAEPPFGPHLSDVAYPAAHGPGDYLAVLQAAGCTVDAWETTYLHVLSGPDPVLRWISGTGARPVLQALSEPLRRDFEREYAALLAEAYPATEYGTVLPFRRVFAVAQRRRHAGA